MNSGILIPLATVLILGAGAVIELVPFRIGFSATPVAAPPEVFSPANPPLGVEEVERLITAAAAKHKMPAAFVQSIVAAESNFNSQAISPKGAIGLMQVMPDTAKLFGDDPNLPDQNVDAGTHYLRVLWDRYSRYRNPLPRVIAAYNAGPGMVDKYRGIPPFRETHDYVLRVLTFLRHFGRESVLPAKFELTGFLRRNASHIWRRRAMPG